MLVCLRVVFQEEHMTTTLTIIRVFKWLSALGLLLTVAIGAAMIDRRFTMLLLPPFFMHTRCVKNKADVVGCRSPTGRLAEGGRSLGQPGAFFYSGMWEAAAQWLRPLRPPTYLASEISGRPPASASLGQPRSIGRDVRTGRPRRLCSPPRYWGQSDSFGEIPLVKLLKLPFTHLSVSVQRLFLAGAGVGCALLLDWLLAPAAAPPTK